MVLQTPPESHREGPIYLGILKYTDIPEMVLLMKDKIKLYGDVPLALQLYLGQAGLEKTVLAESLKDCLP